MGAPSTPVFTFLSKIDLFCLAKARPCVNNGLTLLLLSLFTQSYSIALYSDYIVWWITRLNKAAGSSQRYTYRSTPNNSKETYTFMCLGRAGCFWAVLKLFLDSNMNSNRLTHIYRTRAIIGRSWLEAALEYKPYIRPKVTVHKWSLEMG